jgi:RNA 3'-terminal phosphate cyclase (ATP)
MGMRTDLFVIDGSHGEGGGQILRTALSLSLTTGRPFVMSRIRAKRNRPGLLRQHLTAVRAAAEISGARVDGAELGSGQLTFHPGPLVPGRYTCAVGTAGSVTLVLHALLPALVAAGGAFELTLEGGTHNPGAPPYEHLAGALLPLLGRLGARVTIALDRCGFYPAGGGRLTVEVQPNGRLQPLTLTTRGAAGRRRARALVANLDPRIGQRELAVVRRRLGWSEGDCVLETPDADGPGNAVLLEIASEHVTDVFTGFGEIGVRAEVIASRVADEARKYLALDAPVGPYLADQLLVPLAAGSGGVFRTGALSRHTTTNIDVIRAMTDARIEVADDRGDGTHTVTVTPC